MINRDSRVGGRGVDRGFQTLSLCVRRICRGSDRDFQPDAACERRRALETVRRGSAHSGSGSAAVQQAELVQRRSHLPVMDGTAQLQGADGWRCRFGSECRCDRENAMSRSANR